MHTVVLLLDQKRQLVAAMLPEHAPSGMHSRMLPAAGQTLHTVELAVNPVQLAPKELKRLIGEKLAEPDGLKPYVETRGPQS